jgi:hypothetical protein
LLNFNHSAKLRTKTSLTEAAANILVQKYQPVVYLHKSEAYFPTKIENLGIDWSKATFGVVDTEVDFSYQGPSSFDSSAPIYTSVYENTSSNTVRISYLFFYGYNGCGPKASIVASVGSLKLNEKVSLCPADLHWGDVEHIEVTLSKSNSNASYDTIYSILYADHKWSKTYTADGSQDGKLSTYVTFFDNTHPIVYSANGSHASYPSPGDNYYYTIFSESKKILFVKESASLEFVDSCAPNTTDAYKWYGNAKMLKLNGNAVSGISTQEYNVAFKYYGRLGAQINNTGASDLVTVLNKIKTVSKDIGFSALTNAIDSAESNLNTYFQATGVSSIGNPSRTYW